ncbi:hypothetical protein KIPB_000714 [Kipferlia bialata]|uniref:Ribosomal RNA large subunit methyltransferase K/L-like methyltransferase domain-containing protein n=1 Tax=Kipferlia bialata TaxID=797122 RepID=A0A9K3GEW7_9EUKA|nr:hypothetical protein KIPB_000714 [Kipferlia bialata]|eukprot:g714.t1
MSRLSLSVSRFTGAWDLTQRGLRRERSVVASGAMNMIREAQAGEPCNASVQYCRDTLPLFVDTCRATKTHYLTIHRFRAKKDGEAGRHSRIHAWRTLIQSMGSPDPLGHSTLDFNAPGVLRVEILDLDFTTCKAPIRRDVWYTPRLLEFGEAEAAFTRSLAAKEALHPDPISHTPIPLPEGGRLRCTVLGWRIGNSRRGAISDLSLKTRAHIGPTSMDPLASAVMVNATKARRGSLVLEPCFGTGSIGVAASHAGCHVFGSEASAKVIAGKGGVKAWDNFRQYSLPCTSICQGDVFKLPYRDRIAADAVVTDPPYGVREGKRGGEKERDVFLGLLDESSRCLREGGRLCYCMPYIEGLSDPRDIPCHPCLDKIAAVYQKFSRKHGRWYVVMQRNSEPYRVAAHYEGIANPAHTFYKAVVFTTDFRAVIKGELEERAARDAKGPQAKRQSL